MYIQDYLPPEHFNFYADNNLATIDLIPKEDDNSFSFINCYNAKKNTILLQQKIITLSKQGGGTIYLPRGEYLFSFSEANPSGNTTLLNNRPEAYCIKLYSNVSIMGAGESSTILKPICKKSQQKYGVDMFYFNDFEEYCSANNGEMPKDEINNYYLSNCNFSFFTIDGIDTECEHYNSSSKGFMINLFKNCHWENVTIKNTLGTGFGVDCPLDSSIRKCTAINCGRGAKGKERKYGASGIGIGYGYVDHESLIIDSCVTKQNNNFGIFIEHQGRFSPGHYYKIKNHKFYITNCSSMNNLHNYGGILLHNAVFSNCDSVTPKKEHYLLDTSNNCVIKNCMPKNTYSTITTDYTKKNHKHYQWLYTSGINQCFSTSPKKASWNIFEKIQQSLKKILT